MENRRLSPRTDPTLPNQAHTRQFAHTAEQETAACRLAALRHAAGEPGYEFPDLDVALAASAANRRAREVLGLDGGPRRRLTPSERRESPADPEQYLLGNERRLAALRQAVAQAGAFWPASDLRTVETLVEAVIDALPDVDPERCAKWARSVFMAGIARQPPADSDLLPFKIRTREQFLAFSGLTDQALAEIESCVGSDGVAPRVVVAAFKAANAAGLVAAPVGIIAATRHVYLPKGTQAIGKFAAHASPEDADDENGEAGDSIFRQARAGAAFVADLTSAGCPALFRGATKPLLGPADLRVLEGGASAEQRFTREWVDQCGLRELWENGRTSATLQQAAAAGSLARTWNEEELVIVLPGIRVECARKSDAFPCPLANVDREMPGNSIHDLRETRNILHGATDLWIAETGVEESTLARIVEPEWRLRVDGMFPPGRLPIDHPDHATWVDVYEIPDVVRIRELRHPVALSARDPHGDLALLQITGESDPEAGTTPVAYWVASRSLQLAPGLASKAAQVMVRMHGRERDASALRRARTAAMVRPGRVLAARAKRPRPWMTRELERQLAGMARALGRERG